MSNNSLEDRIDQFIIDYNCVAADPITLFIEAQECIVNLDEELADAYEKINEDIIEAWGTRADHKPDSYNAIGGYGVRMQGEFHNLATIFQHKKPT
jgi:hypothetical protein